MSVNDAFQSAVDAIEVGDVERLQEIVSATPSVVSATDDGNATLLIRLIDWPGHRPNAAESARLLLDAGAHVDARRDDQNGTALSGAVCTEEVDVIQVLIDGGADIHAPCGWQAGTVLDLADATCENLHRRGDETVKAIATIFRDASGRDVPRRTRIGNPVPLLFVSDFAEAMRLYTEQLGFRVAWTFDENPDHPYASIVRGNTDFHLTVCHCEDRGHIGKLDVRIETENCDALYEELQDADVTVRSEPNDQPWGLREFEIEDPDGNALTFFQH